MQTLSHTFAICAYKESSYLEECIQSLKKQKLKSSFIMITSTPNDHIQLMAKKYEIPLYINEGEKGITQDWNFAYRMADTELVTIAHQDDVYLPEYSDEIVKIISKSKKPLIAFTDYGEIRKDKPVLKNKLLQVKRLLLFPLRYSLLQKSVFVRRRVLSLGCPICCPAVTFVKRNLPEQVFQSGYRSAEDWEAWEKISKIKGSFLYTKKIGMYHRIHEESETSIILGDHARNEEDFQMFCKFWPIPIARVLAKLYSSSEKSNEL